MTMLKLLKTIANTMSTKKLAKPELKFTMSPTDVLERIAYRGKRKLSISKHLNENEKHTGEYKVFVDDEWVETAGSYKQAKEAANAIVENRRP
tara:strand:+ start:527 stop:805 length:279 start_codon:yes stop_codon:yes gene_type:complete